MIPKTVGIWWNASKDRAAPVARRVVDILERFNVGVRLEDALACRLDRGELSEGAGCFFGCDALIVLGGDGTLLAAMRAVCRSDIPLLGVNLGRIGYLSEIEPDQLEEELPKFLRGEARVDSRLLLSASTPGEDAGIALNECVVARPPEGLRMIGLSLYVDGTLTQQYMGDGLIVSTPTGSTAYSFSAGGPVVSPEAEVFVATPICPHSLQNRPLVLPAGATIRICADTEARAVLDGQVSFPAREVVIRASEHRARFLRVGQMSFYERLGAKLRLTGTL